jgi:hypothetical protein
VSIPVAWSISAPRDLHRLPARSAAAAASRPAFRVARASRVPIRADRAFGLVTVQEQQSGGVGEQQRIAECGHAQRARQPPVELKHPDPDRADLEREGKDAGRARRERGGRERGPAAHDVLVREV